jgi:hypothetical protein
MDLPATITAACGGVAAIIAAVTGLLNARSANRIRAEQARQEMKLQLVASKQDALKTDHERSARDLGQRTYALLDSVNTLREQTGTVQRRVEKIPTESQWAFRMGQTPLPGAIVADEPLEVTPPLKGPVPPPVAPFHAHEKKK